MIDVKKTASLARLALSEGEMARYEDQFKAIIGHFEKLAAVDTAGVEPLVTPTDMPQNWREDKVENWKGADKAMENAPEVSGHLFKVPPVV